MIDIQAYQITIGRFNSSKTKTSNIKDHDYYELSNVKNLADATDQISHRFLIIRAGDVETNPGPVRYEQYTPKPLKNDGDNICFDN